MNKKRNSTYRNVIRTFQTNSYKRKRSSNIRKRYLGDVREEIIIIILTTFAVCVLFKYFGKGFFANNMLGRDRIYNCIELTKTKKITFFSLYIKLFISNFNILVALAFVTRIRVGKYIRQTIIVLNIVYFELGILGTIQSGFPIAIKTKILILLFTDCISIIVMLVVLKYMKDLFNCYETESNIRKVFISFLKINALFLITVLTISLWQVCAVKLASIL